MNISLFLLPISTGGYYKADSKRENSLRQNFVRNSIDPYSAPYVRYTASGNTSGRPFAHSQPSRDLKESILKDSFRINEKRNDEVSEIYGQSRPQSEREVSKPEYIKGGSHISKNPSETILKENSGPQPSRPNVLDQNKAFDKQKKALDIEMKEMSKKQEKQKHEAKKDEAQKDDWWSLFEKIE